MRAYGYTMAALYAQIFRIILRRGKRSVILALDKPHGACFYTYAIALAFFLIDHEKAHTFSP
jgi:hypothetical protein